MKLTNEESRKVDEALAILKSKLKARLQEIPPQPGRTMHTDDKFVKAIKESYLSEDGFINLLADSGLLFSDEWCPGCGSGPPCDCSAHCENSCSQPQKDVCCAGNSSSPSKVKRP